MLGLGLMLMLAAPAQPSSAAPRAAAGAALALPASQAAGPVRLAQGAPTSGPHERAPGHWPRLFGWTSFGLSLLAFTGAGLGWGEYASSPLRPSERCGISLSVAGGVLLGASVGLLVWGYSLQEEDADAVSLVPLGEGAGLVWSRRW